MFGAFEPSLDGEVILVTIALATTSFPVYNRDIDQNTVQYVAGGYSHQGKKGLFDS